MRTILQRVILATCLVGIAVCLYVTIVASQTCPPNGDVNQDSNLTPADALLAFQHFLGIANPSLNACQQGRADINRDASITPADALCIFQEFLGLPSCLDATFDTCGGIAGLLCQENEVCDFRDETCSILDLQGLCVPRPEVCTTVFLPVCGCDGVTYPNDCARVSAEVTLAHTGECP